MILTTLTVMAVVTILVAVNALYVAGEFATVSARKMRVVQMAEAGHRLARVLRPVLEDTHKLDNYIAACQVGITISSLVLGIYGEQQIAPLLAPWIARLPLGLEGAVGSSVAAAGIATTLVLIVLTTLQVVMGELLPKSIAIGYPETLALATALPIKWSADCLFRPLILLLNGSGTLILKWLGVSHGREHAHLHSPEEILILVQESHQGGLIDADERQWLRNVFRVSETPVGEVAVPRNRLVAAEVGWSIEAVLKLAAESDYTRIPIYEQDLDHIIGYVHLRDLFVACQPACDTGLRELIRPAPYLPETLTVTEAWRMLNEAQAYLAIVFDEYGGTSGLVTREDLIEELFGEVQDEFDHEPEPFRRLGQGRFALRGDTTVADLNETLGIHLSQEVAHTVGGLVVAALGRMPQVGDVVVIDRVQLRVDAIAHKSVAAVTLSLLPDAAAREVGG